VTLWRKRHQAKIELKNHKKKIVSRREVAAEVQRGDCWDCWKAKLSEIIILITTKMKTEEIQISVVVVPSILSGVSANAVPFVKRPRNPLQSDNLPLLYRQRQVSAVGANN